MATIGQRMTADEYLALDRPQWPKMELIDGEIVVNQPSRRHQAIVGHLLVELVLWARAGDDRGTVLLAVDHRVDDRNVLAPDVWWSPLNWASPSPAIAIEVRSPSTWRYDTGLKLQRCLAGGSLEVWLVDADSEHIIVNHRGGDHALLTDDDGLTSPLLPGLSLSVGELFDR